MKKTKTHRPMIRSRHHSHGILRNHLPMMDFRSIIRLGSTFALEGVVSEGGTIVEINTIDSVQNSSSKLLMKQCFMKAKVNTAEWFRVNEEGVFLRQLPLDKSEAVPYDKLPVPIIAKGIFGSRGTSNYKFDTVVELKAFLLKKPASKYIFERYYPYMREYRLHVSADGCFYTCRKMLRTDAPKEGLWQRHDDNCVWFLEDNPQFDKPVNWDEIVEQCVRALKSVGLDMASFDVRVQSATNPKTKKAREKCEFIIIECNSASSFGDKPLESVVAAKYLETIPKILKKKAAELALKTEEVNN